MSKQSIIDQLRHKRFQARQLHPNAMVVSWEEAKKAIEKAYNEGMCLMTNEISKDNNDTK